MGRVEQPRRVATVASVRVALVLAIAGGVLVGVPRLDLGAVASFEALFAGIPVFAWAAAVGLWALLASVPDGPGVWRDLGIGGVAITALGCACLPYVLMMEDMIGRARSPIFELLVAGTLLAVVGALGWVLTSAVRLADRRSPAA